MNVYLFITSIAVKDVAEVTFAYPYKMSAADKSGNLFEAEHLNKVMSIIFYQNSLE